MIGVITLSREQYEHHVRHTLPENRAHFYIKNATQLRGMREVDFVVAGQFYMRKDLPDILEQLYICNIGTEHEERTEALFRLWGGRTNGGPRKRS